MKMMTIDEFQAWLRDISNRARERTNEWMNTGSADWTFGERVNAECQMDHEVRLRALEALFSASGTDAAKVEVEPEPEPTPEPKKPRFF